MTNPVTEIDSPVFLFGDWRVEPGLNRLSRAGEDLQLEPKTMEVLVHLIEHAERAVSADELLDAIWPGRVVEQSTVHRRINELRRALSDDSRNPSYIQTIVKRGYRAIAPIELVRSAPLAEIAQPFTAHEYQVEAGPYRGRWRLYRWLAAVSLPIAAIGFAIWLQIEPTPEDGPQQRVTEAPTARDRSMAIVSFSAADNDAAAATYARALVEELRSAITDYPELRIVAVSEKVDPREIDEASYVLGGSVQRLGGSMRLRTHLTRTDDQHIVWAKPFEHPVSNGAANAAEMATTVAQFVRVQLSVEIPRCESVRSSTPSQEAADAYCVALTEAARGGHDLRLVLNSALRATALDPTIANAHSLIGYAYFQLGELGQMDWQQATQQARTALARRLTLAPHDARSLGLQGRIEQLEMNYPAAELSFRESLSRDPLDFTLSPIHARLGMLAVAEGRTAEAIEHCRRALRINDSNGNMYMNLGQNLWFAGEYKEAIDVVDTGLRLVDSGYTHTNLLGIKIAAYDALGARSRANEILDEALASVESGSKRWLAWSLASLGRTEEARQLLAMLEGLQQPPVDVIAETYAALGDERALDWIHKAIDHHLVLMISKLRASPVYSELRKDPRWAEVISHLEAEEAKGQALFNEPK